MDAHVDIKHDTIRSVVKESIMITKEEVLKLREKTGMNRREFCDYFERPYRTVQDWELGNRRIPEYLYRLMSYKIRMEKLDKKSKRRA